MAVIAARCPVIARGDNGADSICSMFFFAWGGREVMANNRRRILLRG